MASTAFAGLRGTGKFATNELPQDFREYILWKNPAPTPLFALMSKMKKESCIDTQINWWEEKQRNLRVTINTGTTYATTSTALTVDSAADASVSGLDFNIGDVLLVEEADATTYSVEHVIVSTAPTATAIGVTRGYAGTTPATIADNVVLMKIGNSFEEGEALPNIVQRNPTQLSNITQIFRSVYGATETAKAVKTRTGNPLQNDRKRKSFDHARDIEWSMLLGLMNLGDGTSQKKRTMNGLRPFLTTNSMVFTTTPTVSTILNAIGPCFDYGVEGEMSNERICLAGSAFMNNLNVILKTDSSSRLQWDGTLDVYGLKLSKLILPQGTIGFLQHPLMSIHPIYKYGAFIINPKGIIYRPLQGRDTKDLKNRQAPGDDSEKGEWLTECTMEVHGEETMMYMGNFTNP